MFVKFLVKEGNNSVGCPGRIENDINFHYLFGEHQHKRQDADGYVETNLNFLSPAFFCLHQKIRQNEYRKE